MIIAIIIIALAIGISILQPQRHITPVTQRELEFRMLGTPKPKTTHANDPENVHDRGVINSIARKYARLVELYSHESYKYGMNDTEFMECQIQAALQAAKSAAERFSADAQEKIHRFLDRVAAKCVITSFDYDVYEDIIFMLVWNRIHHPDNADQQDAMLETLFLQILDGMSTGSPVCTNGRVSRVISSLTLLDADPVLYAPELDNSEIANLAYLRANRIITQELAAWRMKHPELPNWYDSGVDNATVAEFQQHCRQLIEKNIKEDFQDMVSDRYLHTVISNAIQAV